MAKDGPDGTAAGRLALAAALLVGAALLSVGCSPLHAIAYFFTPEHREQPLCPLACADREVTVVVLANFATPPPHGPLFRSDEDLAVGVTRMLEAQFKENGEKVKLVAQGLVKAYQNKNPRWRELPPQDVGKHFKADYVINLEINSISLADPKNAAYLYQGRADVAVTLTDVSKPVGEGVKFDQPYSIQYPERGPMDRNDIGPVQFRALLLNRVAKDITYMFASHAPRE